MGKVNSKLQKRFEKLFLDAANITKIKNEKVMKKRISKLKSETDKITKAASAEWCKRKGISKKACSSKWKKEMKKYEF
jgi:hypothetical protein